MPPLVRRSWCSFLALMALAPVLASARADEPVPHSRGLAHGTPQRQAPYRPGRTPYRTGAFGRPKYFVPPTNPRTPTSKMYGTPPGLVPGDWPSYAPFGFGGYRFPAVGPQAYR